MNDEIMVSVSCMVYNHEKYLRKCLDGFVNQKTNFKFEVFVHDDASTDSSAEIIREYQSKYPDIIKPIFQTENQYSRKVNIAWEIVYPKFSGKYMAICEGDDYWCDCSKLQKQFDIMEKHPECVICTHGVRKINEDGSMTDELYSLDVKCDTMFSKREFLEMMTSVEHYPAQTSSYFIRMDVVRPWLKKRPDFMYARTAGDIKLLMLLATQGGLYHMADVMSCYRVCSIGSCTHRFKNNNDLRISNYENNIKLYEKFDTYTNFEFHESIEKVKDKMKFDIYEVKYDLKNMKQDKYKEYYYKIKPRRRLLYHIEYYVPGLGKQMRKIWDKLKAENR